MTFAVRVVASDPTPPFEQVRRQLADAIADGALPTGTRLPTVRQLASDLGLAPGTVMRAYRELEAFGLIATARGRGTTVSGTPRRDPAAALIELAASFVARARATGASDERIVAAVRDAVD